MSGRIYRRFRFAAMLFLLLGMAPAIIAQPLQQLEEANQAFLDKNFEEAIGLYESILQDGYYAPGLYYNLGNAYFRVGKLGKAILHYERALKWSPDDEQVLQNLEIARSQLKDDLLVVPESGLVRRWHA
ncbi:MAG: tetratricopeptide repeat protein, partial [Phaeodactylibacter sp.]|nr:tetratricopeptide repeat protein [Phaeodactylibacter sp.]